MTRLSPQELSERRDFALNRLKRGFSFLETRKQFAQVYSCPLATARKWIDWACDQISEADSSENRKRVSTIFLEMYHDQIISYQNELIAMQREIDLATTVIDRRTAILTDLEVSEGSRHRELIAELEILPNLGYTTRAGLIEAKSRIRERMYRVMTDLARMRGVGISSDWRQALNTLLDNNLIPPAIAEGILTVITGFESGLTAAEAQDTDSDDADQPVESEHDLDLNNAPDD